MKYIIHVFFIFIIGCNIHKVEQKEKTYHHVDSAVHNSRKLHDSAIYLHKIVDEQTKVVFGNVLEQVDDLKSDNQLLRNQVDVLNHRTKLIQTITIHDTIFITEKKNFWGKTKVITDSSSSIIMDSTEIEN